MSNRSMDFLAIVLLTFMLVSVLLTAASIEAARRMQEIEHALDNAIETQEKAIKRLDDKMEKQILEYKDLRGEVKVLDGNVEYFLTGKWK